MWKHLSEFLVDLFLDLVGRSILNDRQLVALKEEGDCLTSDEVVMVIQTLWMVLEDDSVRSVVLSEEHPWELLSSPIREWRG